MVEYEVFGWLHLVNEAGDGGFIVPHDFPAIEELKRDGYHERWPTAEPPPESVG